MEGAHSRASVCPASRNILHKHTRGKAIALFMNVLNFATCFHHLRLPTYNKYLILIRRKNPNCILVLLKKKKAHTGRED